MRETGWARHGTAKVCKHGQTGVVTRASGAMTKPMERESCGTQMAIFMKVNGLTTGRTVTAYILTQMEPSTKETGSRTSRRVKEERTGLMVRSTRESTRTAENMGRVVCSLLMEVYMRVLL